MNITKTIRQILLCFICLISISDLWAQNKQQFNLLDQDNSLPIQGVSFIYGNQTGASNENGTIFFEFSEGHTMQLSHITYGDWELNAHDLQQVIAQKVYYRKKEIQNIYPVTVIALRSGDKPCDKINMSYMDKIAHDGSAILMQSPAISSIRKGGRYGYDPVFRGFKYDQLNVVLNGAQSATAACPNRMDPPTSQMAPNMMDRIEILKGPHALRYGTGFGGTINFVPSQMRFSDEKDMYGRVSSGYESNGEVFRSEGHLGFNGQSYDLSFLGSWSQGNDYSSGNNTTIPADFERGSLGANLGFKLAPNHQLRVLSIYNMARDADFPALAMDLRSDDTWMFNVRHDAIINKEHLKSWNTAIFGSFVDHEMDNLLKDLNPRKMNASTIATTYNYGTRTEGIWDFKNSNLYAGADFKAEGADGTRTREFLMGENAGKEVKDNVWQDGRIIKTGLFGEYHLNANKYQFVLSGRLDIVHADINDPSNEFEQVYSKTKETQFNPNVSFGVSNSISKNTKLGVWLGRAQRGGSLTERYINYFPVGQDPYEMLGNPVLKPEVNNQVDLTLNRTTDNSAIDIDVFASYLQDAISSVIDPELDARLPNSPGVRRYVNIDDAFKTGFEINWTQNIGAGLFHQMGVAYTYAQDLEQDEPLPEIAPLDFKYSLWGKYFNEKLIPEFTFRHVLEQSRISTEYGETKTPSFSIVDIKLSYLISKSIKVNAGVNNLFNENYYEHLSRSVKGTPTPIYDVGRNIFASFSVNF
ncbi:TonB-dependent receptor [Labilibacter sediminis]|nr:TonB-dependent receptor [Labilibacter sediminis]